MYLVTTACLMLEVQVVIFAWRWSFSEGGLCAARRAVLSNTNGPAVLFSLSCQLSYFSATLAIEMTNTILAKHKGHTTTHCLPSITKLKQVREQ